MSAKSTVDAKCEVCGGWLIFRDGVFVHRDIPKRDHEPKPSPTL